MSSTANLGLDLVQPAQAQKHVTVNEAFVRLDGVAQLVLQDIGLINAPAMAQDGQCWGIPVGATGAWQGHAGDIALWSNGGWVFLAPQQGWRAWVASSAAYGFFDGTKWHTDVVAASPNGAMTRQVIFETVHTVTTGPTTTIAGAIPNGSMVIGVTANVITDITGALTSWRMGVPGEDGKFGTGLGLATGSWVRGLLSAPTTYYADTDLILSGEGGDFSGGELRVSVHAIRLECPTG